MKRKTQPTYSIPADDAWAAAFTAWRLNGNLYRKAVTTDSGLHSNKEIMIRVLIETPEEITDEDRKQGQSARGHLGSAISLRLLKGETLTEWHTVQGKICNLETLVTAYDLAVLASFPQSYSKIRADEQIQDRLDQCEDKPVGQDRMTLTVEVVRCVRSWKYDCWFVWAIDQHNHAVRFPYREQVQPGAKLDIIGSVRGFSNRTSRLNRVKILQQEAVA